jgi:hypothetical protein
LLERRGDRDGALRVLGGVVASGSADADTLTMLAVTSERAGRTVEACAFRIAAAEQRPTDAVFVAPAAMCERTAGNTASADLWIDGSGARAKVEAQIAKLSSAASNAENTAYGDIVVDATWDAGADLDVAVIDPSGTRFAWASRSKGLRASDCTSRSHESIALSDNASGAFTVEVVRADGSSGTISGKLRVTSIGAGTRIIPFVLAGNSTRVQVARIDYRWDSSLVAATDSDLSSR